MFITAEIIIIIIIIIIKVFMGSYEHGNDYLSIFQLLKKDCVPWS